MSLRAPSAMAALLFPLPAAMAETNREKVEILVSAAASLEPALSAAREIIAQIVPEARLSFNFAASGVLQHQIEAGGPVDIFLSAAAEQMDALERQEWIVAGSRITLFRSQLALVAPLDSKFPRSVKDLVRPLVRFVAIGDPATVPAGRYAMQVLEKENIVSALAAKQVRGSSVRQVVQFVESGNADAGFVYATDARNSKKLRIVEELDPSRHSPIVYQAARIRASRHPETAQKVLNGLLCPEVQKHFSKLGFLLEKSNASECPQGMNK